MTIDDRFHHLRKWTLKGVEEPLNWQETMDHFAGDPIPEIEVEYFPVPAPPEAIQQEFVRVIFDLQRVSNSRSLYDNEDFLRAKVRYLGRLVEYYYPSDPDLFQDMEENWYRHFDPAPDFRSEFLKAETEDIRDLAY